MELYWINSYIDFRFTSSLESRYFGAGNTLFGPICNIFCANLAS